MLFGLQLSRRVCNTSQKSSTQGVFHKSILMNLEKSARLGFWLKSRAKSSHCLICSFSDHSAWGRAHKKWKKIMISFANESYLYETDLTLGPNKKKV